MIADLDLHRVFLMHAAYIKRHAQKKGAAAAHSSLCDSVLYQPYTISATRSMHPVMVVAQ